MYLFKNVLIVDDDPGDLVIFSRMLGKLDPAITCHTADNALHGLRMISDTPGVDLVFTDLNMPGMDGFEFLESLRSDSGTRALPCIVCTSSKDESIRKKALGLGATGFIVKPNQPDHLKSMLHDVLSGNMVV